MPTIEADVVFSAFSSGDAAKALFTRPTRFIQIPTPPGQGYAAFVSGLGNRPILKLLQTYAPGVRALRVGLLGFSEGCQFVREMLKSPDGGRIDAAIAIDGIHAQYQPGDKTRIVPAYLTAWGAMGLRAAQGRTLLAITASTIRPPGFASTTETANWIWRYATGGDGDAQTTPIAPVLITPYSPPVVYSAGHDKSGVAWPSTSYGDPPVTHYRREHGLVVVNYTDRDPTGHNDHLFQGQHVLPDVVAYYLGDRWSSNAPDAGICTLAGIGDEPVRSFGRLGDGCFPPSELSDAYMAGSADPKPLDVPLDAQVDPTLPGTSPTGGAASPPGDAPATSTGDTFWTAAKWVGAAAGVAIVGEVTRRTLFPPRKVT